jgi:hypothetical protein
MDENVNITYNGRPLYYGLNDSRLKLSDSSERFTSPYSIRFKFGTDRNTNELFNPLDYSWSKGTWHHVSGSVWEWTYENTVWNNNGSPIFGINPHFNHISYTDVISINASEVTNMDKLFYNINPTPHDGQAFYYTAGLQFANVTSMEEMFYKTPVSLDFQYLNVPKVRNMKNFMNLTGVDLTRWDDESTWNYPRGFTGINIAVDPWDEKPYLRYCDLTNAFKGCINLTGETAYAMYTGLSLVSQSATDGCFENCAVTDPDPYSQSLYRQIPSSWK